MQSPPFPRYLVLPRSKYSPQHHVLKHPQLPFLPPCQRPSFTPIQNNRQNYSSLNFWIATWKTKRITSIVKLQWDTTFDVYIVMGCFYVACLNNYTFRPPYWPSKGCTLSYYKTNYTIYNVLIFVDEIWFPAVEFTFKIITVVKIR